MKISLHLLLMIKFFECGQLVFLVMSIGAYGFNIPPGCMISEGAFNVT